MNWAVSGVEFLARIVSDGAPDAATAIAGLVNSA